MRSASILII
jgi:CheY-like chemotaxis protein